MKKTFTILALSTFSIGCVFAQRSVNLPATQYMQGNPVKTELKKEETPVVQRKCGTPSAVNESFETWIDNEIKKREQFANAKTAAVVYTIPIIFHIIHTGQAVGSGRNLSLAQINSQITRLNEDYRKLNADRTTYLTQPALSALHADCEINFCAAKVSPTGAVLTEPGVERILASSKGWTSPPYSGMSPSYLEGTVKPTSIWDPTKYFNVWVAEFNDGVLGYAQFPVAPSSTTGTIGDLSSMPNSATTDGVVLDYKYTGLSGSAGGPYNLGRTLTHEAGHWLGLYHIWGDDFGSCSGTDRVTDTPNQAGENYTCPTTAGSVKTDACTASSPGVLYQNYMDYSDDKCMVMFTAGQKARLQAVMANCVRRNSLASSTACTAPSSIYENSSIVDLSIFPNPTNGEINVTVDLLNNEDFTVSVTNTLGQIVKEVKQLHSNGATVKVDLVGNANGIYFVTVKTKTGSRTKRVVLQ